MDQATRAVAKLVWRHDGLTKPAALKYEISLKRDKDTPRFYTRTGLTPPAPVEVVVEEAPVAPATDASAQATPGA